MVLTLVILALGKLETDASMGLLACHLSFLLEFLANERHSIIKNKMKMCLKKTFHIKL